MEKERIKEINEKMAAFIGWKKVTNVRTIIDKVTYLTDEIWVSIFDQVRDEQLVYSDEYPQGELIKMDDIVYKLSFDSNWDDLSLVYDSCQQLLFSFMEDGRCGTKYTEGACILEGILPEMKVKDSYIKINNFIDWYNKNKVGNVENNS